MTDIHTYTHTPFPLIDSAHLVGWAEWKVEIWSDVTIAGRTEGRTDRRTDHCIAWVPDIWQPSILMFSHLNHYWEFKSLLMPPLQLYYYAKSSKENSRFLLTRKIVCNIQDERGRSIFRYIYQQFHLQLQNHWHRKSIIKTSLVAKCEVVLYKRSIYIKNI